MYATIADRQWETSQDMLTVGTLESYEKMLSYFEKSGTWSLVPIYIEIPEKVRRERALSREMAQEHPKIEERQKTPHEKFRQKYVFPVRNILPQVQEKKKELQEKKKTELEKE